MSRRPKYCPDCSEELLANICSCGWKWSATPASFDSHQCAYEDAGQQCPLAGTQTDSVKPGESTRWYCRYHRNWHEDPKAASQALSGILSGHFGPSPNWRTQTLREKGRELKKSNPEIFITDATSQEIAEVNLSLIRDLQSRMPELPYKKTTLIEGKGFAEDEILEGFKEIEKSNAA